MAIITSWVQRHGDLFIMPSIMHVLEAVPRDYRKGLSAEFEVDEVGLQKLFTVYSWGGLWLFDPSEVTSHFRHMWE